MSFRDFVAAAERAETVDLLQPHKDSEYFYLTVSGEEVRVYILALLIDLIAVWR